MASDRYGRRPIIVFGLLLFIIGGVVCALAPSINWIILGRVIQGLGAVSAAITAWVADATRPEVRTRAMRSEEHTSELQSLMRISYAVFCLKKKTHKKYTTNHHDRDDKYKPLPRILTHLQY